MGSNAQAASQIQGAIAGMAAAITERIEGMQEELSAIHADAGTMPTGAATEATLAAIRTAVQAAIPAGSNTIGKVDQGTNPWTVSGTVLIGGQPIQVTLSGTPAVTVSGTVNVGNFPATQPVSGTVTASVSGVSTAANQTSELTKLDAIASALGALATQTTLELIRLLLVPKTCKVAAISISGGGPVTVVAAVTSKRIKVASLFMVTGGTTPTLTFKSNTTTLFTLGAGLLGTIVNQAVPPPHCLFGTAAGEALNITMTGLGAGATGILTYFDDDAT